MKKKEKIMIITLFIAAIILSSSISIFATTCIFNSVDVSYDNSNSGLTSTNVQASLDELYGHCTDYTEIREMIYPVGSIYISVTDDTVAKVETRFGGSWEKFGEGKTLVSASNDYPINTTGGSVSESYTPAGNNTGGTVQSHTLTRNEIPNYSLGFLAVSVPSYHTQYNNNGIIGSNVSSSGKNCTIGNSGCTGASIQYGFNINSNGGDGGHSHGFTNPTFTGTAATISHMQPYITVYMYKRTA